VITEAKDPPAARALADRALAAVRAAIAASG
jgi:hypothetical protein